MTQALIVLSMWLHALGTVVFIGHYLLLSLIYLPALDDDNRAIFSKISRKSRRWLYLSLVIFSLTGVYLTFVDPNYLGLANFGNLWGVLMLIKHLLIVGMIAMGFWVNAFLRVGPMMSSSNNAELAFRRFRRYSSVMAILGVLILLLTALAQVE
jgi:uncharacterized membrane protein